MTTLYRKYRPQSFSEVVGQEHIVTILQNALTQNKIAHGYLFTGPRGTGKTTTARILASKLNCNDLDIIEIDAASNRGIDEMRTLRENVHISTGINNWRVCILDEAHMLTTAAANALLKSLEEPPARTVFILVTTESDKIIPTIKSRLQVLPFQSISLNNIITRLEQIINKEKLDIEHKVIKAIAINAEGGMRDAESNLAKIINIKKGEKIVLDDIRHILGIVDHHLIAKYIDLLFKKDKEKIFAFLITLEKKGISVKNFLKVVLEYWRRLVILSINPNITNELKIQLTKEDLGIIVRQAQKCNTNLLIKGAPIFLNAFKNTDNYPQDIMALEIATLQCLDLIKNS